MPQRELYVSFLVLFCTLFVGILNLPGTSYAAYYVKTPANGGNDANDGTTWATAKATIGSAIASISGPETVHVAAGTYIENIAFEDDLTLLGGYPADAQAGDPRNPDLNQTIIDGSGSGSVVTISGDTNCTLDGFTLQNGNGNAGGGGAINCITGSAIISNNRMINN